MSGRRKLFAVLYQLAGDASLNTKRSAGESARLTELLLDVLSEPDRYTAKVVRIKHRLAVER